MLPLERQQKIIDLLTIKKVVKITELTEALHVSIETLRRDITLLTRKGKIEKIYGGVKLIESKFGESALGERMGSRLAEKEQIAQTCSSYINDGDCIYIDSGSTTYQIAKYIKHMKKLTVITNSIPVINELLNSHIELIIIGGKVRPHEQSVTAFDYLFNFNELNIAKAFICASGITLEKGISDYSLEEAITRKKIIELSKEVYVAADHTKFEKDVTIGIAPIDNIDYIITDNGVKKEIVEKYKAAGVRLIANGE
ncbi:DeoR/GlpR family DNA-binding transcription regulator [Sporosarcina sp. FSL K6-1522]|uniref:DeoR/GlpR family DNA-binding transcription regulator n=1 Tax=Sporosarcina sp. FSL K6-1522 TaxID=2921554 RepID=UPI00315A85AB